MDELASSIGVSKKTLYKYFHSKEDLVKEVIMDLMQEMMRNIRSLIHNPETEYLEKLKQLIIFIGNLAAKVSQPFLDLQKEFPHLWSEFDEAREKFILSNFRSFFQEGVQKGLIRNDVNQEIILLIFVNSIRAIINPKTLSEVPFAFKDVADGIIKVIFNGILTADYRF
jgi:AcrR family transcriptional regulator